MCFKSLKVSPFLSLKLHIFFPISIPCSYLNICYGHQLLMKFSVSGFDLALNSNMICKLPMCKLCFALSFWMAELFLLKLRSLDQSFVKAKIKTQEHSSELNNIYLITQLLRFSLSDHQR